MKLRYFSIQEAEALLPAISDLFRHAQETKRTIERKIDEWRRTHKSMDLADEAVMRGQVDYLANRLEEDLNKIADMGCVPKDLDMGLVDFPARIDGKEVYLCWKSGEVAVSHWHGLTDGFAGRKKLTAEDVTK